MNYLLDNSGGGGGGGGYWVRFFFELGIFVKKTMGLFLGGIIFYKPFSAIEFSKIFMQPK